MNKKLTIILIVGALVLGLIIGYSLKKETYVSDLGTGNLSLRSSVQKADICAITDNATTACALLNNDADGTPRYIISESLWLNGSSTRAYVMDFSVGSSTTALGSGFDTPTVWATTSVSGTTGNQYYSTSTDWGSTSYRVWPYGYYMILRTDVATSTGGGYFKILYDKNP